MGVSTDALFFYGICFDEEDHEWPWEKRPKKFGLKLGEEGDFVNDQGEYMLPEEHVLGQLGLTEVLEVGTHCLRSCPMGYVAIRDTFVLARRGYPENVSESFHHRDEASLDAHGKHLRKFCDTVGYDFDDLVKTGRVGWWVCSDSDLGG